MVLMENRVKCKEIIELQMKDFIVSFIYFLYTFLNNIYNLMIIIKKLYVDNIFSNRFLNLYFQCYIFKILFFILIECDIGILLNVLGKINLF